jgi:NTE family protein
VVGRVPRRSTVARTPTRPSKRGLALAGGGPLGGIYEIGALAALDDCLTGIDFNALDVYVGVSSGAFVAAGLANGITPAGMSEMFIESDTAIEPFDPAILLRPAYYEYLKRAASIPPLVLTSIWRHISAPSEANLLDSIQRLARVIPAGLFDGAGVEASLARMFSSPGRTNDFRALARKLYIIATDLDTSDSARFGATGLDHIPISRAVQASAALPGLFPPVEIEGRHYTDGALRKTMHASVALEAGAKLVLAINPLVPFDSEEGGDSPRRRASNTPAHLVDGGLPAILSQTFRTMLHSRLREGMQTYKSDYRDADVVLFEPNRYDAEMFFTNVFSYSSRRRLAEHAYQKTRAELVARQAEIGPILERHGISIDLGAATDARARLVGERVADRATFTHFEWTTQTLSDSLADLQRWMVRSGSLWSSNVEAAPEPKPQSVPRGTAKRASRTKVAATRAVKARSRR